MAKKKTANAIKVEAAHLAPNYHPLPVVIVEGHGAWVQDVEGAAFLDALAGYSAVNFGHANRALVKAARKQLETLTMTGRAFHHNQLGKFVTELAALTGMEMVVPMNTGAEGIETAIKAARKWGYQVKGVPVGEAEIIVMQNNFHGRTSTIVSFSDDDDARADFGPYTPGFVTVPFGDLQAVADAITPNTVAVLTEPIQGEAGVIVPPKDFLPGLREICDQNNVLLVVDEVQSGFGRTGANFAVDLVHVKPDLMVLGKALGGGIYPVSAVVGSRDVLSLLTPGTHGSTFWGNPLAATIGREAIRQLEDGIYKENALVRGKQLGQCLKQLQKKYPDQVVDYRRVGLWAGVDFNPEFASGREVCMRLAKHGVLAKDTGGSTLRLSPPLVVTEADIDFLCGALRATVKELANPKKKKFKSKSKSKSRKRKRK